MAEGVGNAPTSARADPVFKTGAASLYLPAFQKWSGWQELHLRPPRSDQGRLLLTLHPESGCQTWTRTKTSGLTGRRATLTPPGNGAADRIPTCIVPFRRRMPHVFGHGSNLKLVSAAGFAPAVTRSQAEHVAATLRTVAPANGWRRGLGSCGDEDRVPWNTYPIEDWRTRRDLHPQPSRRQRVAPLLSYGSEM